MLGFPTEVTIFKATVTLTDAQIKALPTTAFFELVPAQGAGKVIAFVQSYFVSHIVTPYEGIDSDMQAYIAYGDDDAGVIGESMSNDGANATEPGTATTAQTNEFGLLLAASRIAIVGRRAPVVSVVAQAVKTRPLVLDGRWPPNAPLKLAVYNGADFTNGDSANTLTITTLYTVL